MILALSDESLFERVRESESTFACSWRHITPDIVRDIKGKSELHIVQLILPYEINYTALAKLAVQWVV